VIAAMKYSSQGNFSRDEAVSIGSDRSFGLVMPLGSLFLLSLACGVKEIGTSGNTPTVGDRSEMLIGRHCIY